MEAARTLWLDIAPARTEVARRRSGAGLLGFALLFMLFAAEATWLLTGNPESASIVAAAEGIQLPQ